MNKKGLLIAIEGIDGSGKSTLAQNLTTELKKTISVVLTKEPGGTALGRSLRQMLNHATNPLATNAEFLLFAADRAQHFSEIIIPALSRGDWVISDRLADSSLAYQGYGRDLDISIIKMVNEWAMQQVVPDVVIYLDLPVETALKRIYERNHKLTAFEKETHNFWVRVKTGFDQIFKTRENVLRLNAQDDPAVLCSQALEYIKKRYPAV